jgi:alkanesulfonate monooxygenase SsuD/methylene tetrahydromethanopterin reductase-like flavin-dependent oxidoreductase (luciferase family)
MLGAALTPASAELVGRWADGLLTVAHKPQQLRLVMDAFKRGGGEGKPVYVQVALSWARSDAEALRIAHEQWRFLTPGGEISQELRSPDDFDAAARFVTPEHMHENVLVSSDLNRHAAWLAEYAELGVECAFLHHVGLNQRSFIDAFATRVIPQLR